MLGEAGSRTLRESKLRESDRSPDSTPRQARPARHVSSESHNLNFLPPLFPPATSDTYPSMHRITRMLPFLTAKTAKTAKTVENDYGVHGVDIIIVIPPQFWLSYGYINGHVHRSLRLGGIS